MRSLYVLLLSTLTALLPFNPVQAATEYLVVTTDALAPAFQDLANQKVAQGYVTEVVTLEDLTAMAVPGRDVAEQIRTYIQTVYAEGSLRFVLLGGDTEQVPARHAFNDFFPAGGTDIPTDLYFAALDGDWDADGDDVFGEVDVDLADLVPEVAVGRVPARTALEAAQYTVKLSEYEHPDHSAHLSSALFLDEVLFPSPWEPGTQIILDGAEHGEELLSIVQGGSASMTAERFYENYLGFPGALSLSRLGAIDAMNSGDHGLVLHAGHGNETALSMGDQILQSADALALTNGPQHFVLMTLVPFCADFDSDAILEEFIRNPNGGAVAAIGASRATFAISAQATLRDINEQLFIAEAPSLGEALNAVRTARELDVQDNTVWRYSQMSFNLLGDPEVAVGASAIVTAAPIARSGRLLLRPVAPNPFNPAVTISFELSGDERTRTALNLSIFDLAGRRVRTLWDGPLGHGPHEFVWDGRDDAGVGLGSGVYFATVETANERQSAKMVLVK